MVQVEEARRRAAVVSRSGLGIALVVAAGLVFLQATGALSAARDVVLAVLVVAVALGVIFAPLVVRLARSLTAERSERIRSQERAEMAAHLHDSVLQTLALVQKNAGDEREVAALARRQERELRHWLAGRVAEGNRLAAALEAVAGEVEHAHGVDVEVVAVGDCELGERGRALVAAAGEAMVNAAKFGAGSPVSVYAEAGDGRTHVFVRDRGPGFDPGTVPDDRRGVRDSIVGRMERHGGRAEIHSSRGEGTEVEVVIVDDHQLFRAGVRAELSELVEIAGDAATVAEAVKKIREERPDVVLLDVHMPDGGGVEVIRRVSPELPDVRFLALSVSDAAEDVIAVIRAGARGYVTKTISSGELADAIRRVHDGDAVFSPRLAGFVLDAFAGAPLAPAVQGTDADLDQLTPREREVLQHIARGYMYKEIAQRLSISAKTVEAHVSAVLRKLQLSSRHELSRWATERRLV
jgi:DNA-binding NarL/FixJ family response regulator